MGKPAKSTVVQAVEALTLGRECFSEGDVVPFVLLRDQAGTERLIDFESADGRIDDRLISEARDLIRSFRTEVMYALVYDGYLTTDDRKHDAVFAEVGIRGDACAYVIAQKYKRRRRNGVFPPDGEPILVSTVEHLWNKPVKRKTRNSDSR